jgi:hypothetical protein
MKVVPRAHIMREFLCNGVAMNPIYMNRSIVTFEMLWLENYAKESIRLIDLFFSKFVKKQNIFVANLGMYL